MSTGQATRSPRKIVQFFIWVFAAVAVLCVAALSNSTGAVATNAGAQVLSYDTGTALSVAETTQPSETTQVPASVICGAEASGVHTLASDTTVDTNSNGTNTRFASGSDEYMVHFVRGPISAMLGA